MTHHGYDPIIICISNILLNVILKKTLTQQHPYALVFIPHDLRMQFGVISLVGQSCLTLPR